MLLKSGDRVKTEYGMGTVVDSEGVTGCLAGRFRILIDSWKSLPYGLPQMHTHQGGLYIMVSELELVPIE